MSTPLSSVTGCNGGGSGHVMKLPVSGRTVFYESPVTPSRYQDVYRLIRTAAARGDNVGTDEYPTFDGFRSRLLTRASVSAILLDTPTGRDVDDTLAAPVIGFVAVVPCRYARSVNAKVCTIVAAVAPLPDDIIGEKSLYRDVVVIGTSLATSCCGRYSSSRNYNAAMVDVFTSCLRRLETYQAEGFTITACIPDSGKLNGKRTGYEDSYILYKKLDSNLPVSLNQICVWVYGNNNVLENSTVRACVP